MTDILQRWQIAQEEERKHHTGSLEQGICAYAHTYDEYFRYTGGGRHQKGKKIIEIGCADIPGLYYCSGFKRGIVIEPMPSNILIELAKSTEPNIEIIKAPAEDIEFPKVDEVWLFNVLQHVIDPDVIINKAKAAAKIIRFFEPINDHIDLCHLHSFTLDYFKGHFGDCVIHYEDHKGRVQGFHEHECAYGTWIKPKKIKQPK